MKNGLLALALAAGVGFSCQAVQDEQAGVPSPLADSLMSIFVDMTEAVRGNEPDRFFELVHPDEVHNLQAISRKHGYSSLKAYLRSQLHGWPDPDTLVFADITTTGSYARLALTGPGSRLGWGEERVRYTFLLFKRDGTQYKLAAMTGFEKERYDLYGHEITYHETDLPPKLRFPRLL
jgi:hypothetical protein